MSRYKRKTSRKICLTEEERTLHKKISRRKQNERQKELYRTGRDKQQILNQEGNYSSATVALDDRGSLLLGNSIGNGCRWIQYPPT